uniref:maturase-related protein n=1 Tax=Pulsatilla chinensis TaxID=714493 RepID=UPI0022380CBE|nr:maturase-related protein [Pulsatilla chinensis]YP_010542204.1 maturase-related protein [Pulsatilla cernua]YP_010690178.1 maturase-related protein [Pulsatilla dahurica]YP_010690201.1 maturase-related protein [Pulsatilla dahurica]UYG19735.1 maturase-related protein [Pulsatilla chinensis var. kissii]WAL04635.1 maturase [Anemone patens]UYG19651.1 maturase-related protein [Pulsatilla chinensis]UYG19685.1 maturase-related protein [Pulsatilla cernua]WAL04667.1 maturase [Anemone patens]
MKEAIRMVPESIYDPEFPDTSHWSSGRGCHPALRRIKEEWGTSRWFLEFDIRKCFHTIDRHRLIPIFKEEIDDPKLFYPTQKLFSAGRLVGGEKGPYSVPHSVLLSALPGNIYLHKLDQEIGRIRQKHEIPIVQRIRSVLLRTGRIDDQENSGEEASFNAPQDNRAIIVGRVKSIQRKAAFHSLVSSWHTPHTSTPRRRGDQKTPFVFPPSSALAAFLNKPSSLLCAAFLIEAAGLTPKVEFYGRERCNQNWAMRDLLKYCNKRRGLLIELGGKAILVIRSERHLARKLAPFNYHYLIRICYARYADDSLLGIVGAVELLIEIQKRITHFLQSGLNLWVGSAGSTTIAARSTVEFPGTVIREVPPRTTPIQFLRELEKRLRVKHRIHITACHLRSAIHSKFRNLGNSIPIKQLTKGMSGTGSLLDAVQLAETLGTAGVRSPQVSVLWGTVKHIRQGSREISLLHSSGRSNVPSDVQQAVSRSGMSVRKLSLYTPAGRKAAGEGGGNWAGSFSSEFPIQIEAPIKKILRRLRDRGIISRRRPWPIHVACLTNVSDGDIVNRSAGIAISPLSYYRCRDNLYQVRTIVDHQIRWSAIFTPAHKHKSSARNIIPKYPKDSNIVNQEGGKTLAEFPNSIELGKLGPGQDPNNKEHSTTSLV